MGRESVPTVTVQVQLGDDTFQYHEHCEQRLAVQTHDIDPVSLFDNSSKHFDGPFGLSVGNLEGFNFVLNNFDHVLHAACNCWTGDPSDNIGNDVLKGLPRQDTERYPVDSK